MECDIEAYCSQGRCICKDGYHGDGFNCMRDQLCDEKCPQHSRCEGHQCQCYQGYTWSDGQCLREFLIRL